MPVVVVKRTGNARTKRAAIDGVQLTWRPDNTSKPKNLPAGKHVFSWFVRGAKGQKYGFRFVSPAGIPVKPSDTLDSDGMDFGEAPFNL